MSAKYVIGAPLFFSGCPQHPLPFIPALEKIGMYPIGKWPPPPILPCVPIVDSRLNSLQIEKGGEVVPIPKTALVQVFILRRKFIVST